MRIPVLERLQPLRDWASGVEAATQSPFFGKISGLLDRAPAGALVPYARPDENQRVARIGGDGAGDGQRWQTVDVGQIRLGWINNDPAIRKAIAEARRRARHHVLLYWRITAREDQLARVGQALQRCDDDHRISGRLRERLTWHRGRLRTELLIARIRFDADDLLG